MYIKKELDFEDFKKLMVKNDNIILTSTLKLVFDILQAEEKNRIGGIGKEFNFLDIQDRFKEIENIQEKNIYNFDYCYNLNNGNYLLTNLQYKKLDLI